MPLTTLNVVLSKAYPMSVSPSIDFLLRWDHLCHLCTSLFQFHRSDGIVHVHVWLREAVQSAPILKTENALLNIRDCPGFHTQVLRSPTRSFVIKLYITCITILYPTMFFLQIIFCSIIVENCAVICMWGGDW